MMYREQLEEDSEGKTKAQVEAEVSEHRAKLLADAEESNKTEPSKSDSKSGRSRWALLANSDLLRIITMVTGQNASFGQLV